MTYHRVNPVLWDDEKFVELDDLAGKLWLVLLTGPQRTAVPGLQRGSVASLADTLRRPTDAVGKALQALVDAGMVHVDDKRRVIWIPNAPKHNPAESPNHLRAWWNRWNEIPDCDLKFRHIERLKEHAGLDRSEHSKVWAKTFGTVKLIYCEPSPSPSDSPDVSPSEDLPKYVTVSVSANVTGMGGARVRDPAPCPVPREEPNPPPPQEPSALPEPQTGPPPAPAAPPVVSCSTAEALRAFDPTEALYALREASADSPRGGLGRMASAPQLVRLAEIARTASPALTIDHFRTLGEAWRAGKALTFKQKAPDLGWLLHGDADQLMAGIEEATRWKESQTRRASPVRIVPAVPPLEPSPVTPEQLEQLREFVRTHKAGYAG